MHLFVFIIFMAVFGWVLSGMPDYYKKGGK